MWVYVCAAVVWVALIFGIKAVSQQTIAPFKTSQEQTNFYVNMGAGSTYATIQKTVTAACSSGAGTVILLPGANPADTISGAVGCSTVAIIDFTALPAATYAWNGAHYAAVNASGLPAGTGIVKVSGGVAGTAGAADITALWTGACSGTTMLYGDGHCAMPTFSAVGSNYGLQWNNGGGVAGTSFGGVPWLSTTAPPRVATTSDLQGLLAGNLILSLTTNNTGGAATFANGVLNIPTYAGGGGSPGGSAGAVQVNIAGSFGGNTAFTWDNTNLILGAPAFHGGVSGNLQLGTSSTTSTFSDFTLNSSHADATRVGLAGSASDSSLYLYAAAGGGIQFRIGGTAPADGCASFAAGALSSTGTACGSGSGGTGPQYTLTAFTGSGSGSNYALGHFNAKTDSTGNNLTVPGVMLANQPQGMWSATAYNTGGNGANTNGLQTILANATYQAQASSGILIEPGYTEWEQAPLALMTGDRRNVFDTREGSFYLLSLNPGATGSHSNSNIYANCVAHTMPSSTFGSIATEFNSNCLWANYVNDVPGYYDGALDPAQPSGWASATFLKTNITFYGAAINKSLISANLTAQGAGDQQVIDLHSFDNYGGGDKSADEGHHLYRIVDTVGQAYFVGSVGSVADYPTDDYYTLALNATNGQIGVLRLLLNTTTGVIADTIQGSSVPGTGGRLLTMAATTYPVSTVATLTSGDIAPPKNAYQTKTTESITLSTAIDLSTVTPSLIGQGMMLVTNNNTDSMECMPIQSIGTYNSSAQTQAVTTMANEHHSNGATAYLGGMACKFLVGDADVMARTGNNKPTFYVLGSTASNTLLVARQVGGSPDSWTPAGGTVHIYNGGRVLDVRDPNGYSTANTLKVERTGAAIWNPNDGLYSGMIATAQNDTMYYALTDNSPYSGGSSVLYSLNGAQAGGYAPRDVIKIQNNAVDSDYTYGGGPFNLGYLIHSVGPVGGIFKIDQPFRDAFLTQYSCGYDFAKSSSASFAERCANSGRGPNGALLAEGWDVKGDFEVVPFQNSTLWTAIFSYVNGIQLNQFTTIQGTDGPGTASLKVLAPLNGAGVAFWNAGKAQTDGAATFGSTVTTNGQLFATGGIVLGQHNCIIGTDLNGVIGCNSNPISGSTFTGTRYDLQYNGSTVGQVTNNLSTFQVQSTNGSTFALAASGQMRLSASGGTGFGSGGIRVDTYLAGNNGSGLTIRSNSDNGNTGSPLVLQVSDYNTNAFQTVLQANGVTTNGAHAGISLVPNGGTVTLGGDLATLHDTLASGATCGSHAANAMWHDDGFIYVCNAAGTAASRTAVSTF